MRNKLFTALFILWSLLIITLTSYPKLQNPLSDKIWNVDKLAHFAVYAIFSLLFVKMNQHKSLRENGKNLTILALIIPLVDELHQIPIPGRSFSVYDILADLAGFLIIIAYCYWHKA
jgi:VanZ family protein